MQTLDVKACANITDAGFRGLEGLTKLRRLNLSHTGVSDETMGRVGHLASLLWLFVRDCPRISVEGVRKLYPLPSIVWLDISNNVWTAESMKFVARLKSIWRLDLCNGGLRDDDVMYATLLPQLQEITLKGNSELTDACLEPLSRLPMIGCIDVQQCSGISDQALERMRKKPGFRNMSNRKVRFHMHL